MSEEKKFNIRVYGILINEKDEVLISDERRRGISFTKFPGGGLEWGEGTIDCLKREFMEELGIEIEVKNLLYCTDFFLESAWRSNDQLISIYYFIDFLDKNLLNFAKYETPLTEEAEKFRWINRAELSEELFTYPIDKHVGKMLSQMIL